MSHIDQSRVASLPARRIQVAKLKYPRRPVSRWEARVLAEDEFGLWITSLPGEAHHLASGRSLAIRFAGVQLLPRAGWWVAWWWDDPGDRWVAADVCTPCRVENGMWIYEDLEIDVVGGTNGFWQVVDEDEFEAARTSVPFPEDVASAALRARDELVQGMGTGQEPFGSVGWAKLQSVCDQLT